MRCISRKELEIIKELRLLWNQHSEWTRMAINAIVFRLPNEDLTLARLLRNPDDFGRFFYVLW